jgi:hypothetical protein
MNSRRRILDVIGENSFVASQKCNKHAAGMDLDRALDASPDRINAPPCRRPLAANPGKAGILV